MVRGELWVPLDLAEIACPKLVAKGTKPCQFLVGHRFVWGDGSVIHRRAIAVLATSFFFGASAAHASIPSDPEGSSVIVGALSWLQGTLLGTAATVVAVIAVAAVGFGMLTGRINWRHGAVVILGCFILFGATTIVAGLRTAAGGG